MTTTREFAGKRDQEKQRISYLVKIVDRKGSKSGRRKKTTSSELQKTEIRGDS